MREKLNWDAVAAGASEVGRDLLRYLELSLQAGSSFPRTLNVPGGIIFSGNFLLWRKMLGATWCAIGRGHS